MSAKKFTIGQLARETGVNVETVRYYQRMGLITEPIKPETGYRIYPQETGTRIRFIKRAQRLGFTLREIIELLEMGDGRCIDVRQRANEKRILVENQIRDLKALHSTLTKLIDACNTGTSPIDCPIIESLIRDDLKQA